MTNSTRQVDAEIFYYTLLTSIYIIQNKGPFILYSDYHSRIGDKDDFISGVDS